MTAVSRRTKVGLATDSGEQYEIDVPVFGAMVAGMLALRASTGHIYLAMMLDGILPAPVSGRAVVVLPRVLYPGQERSGPEPFLDPQQV
jgi:hypothetical protein